MKRIFVLCIVVLFITPVFSQNDPVPDYLTAYDFPDSVKSLGLLSIHGERTTFGDILAKHKGKKILIDIWGSWCRDCITGYPKHEALRRKVGDRGIAYVFLSTDKDEQKWRNAISKFDIRGEHYLMDGAWKNPLSRYIALDWVPRYLVLDEQGKVIVPKAIHADDSELEKALSRKHP